MANPIIFSSETVVPVSNCGHLVIRYTKGNITLSCLSSSALYAARREEKHRYSPGGIPSHTDSKDLQISSAVEGTAQSKMKIQTEI